MKITSSSVKETEKEIYDLIIQIITLKGIGGLKIVSAQLITQSRNFILNFPCYLDLFKKIITFLK